MCYTQGTLHGVPENPKDSGGFACSRLVTLLLSNRSSTPAPTGWERRLGGTHMQAPEGRMNRRHHMKSGSCRRDEGKRVGSLPNQAEGGSRVQFSPTNLTSEVVSKLIIAPPEESATLPEPTGATFGRTALPQKGERQAGN